ncbi:hypothetical protein HH308_06370 [Gordonia sp. TBRC 11910]|uniref:Uncharacterized protein n=1 Tax=Gordonia asplenii TaxID=2725283 RepID=A0A848KS86_9ACTN|nr:hypothetical protein [Gordonia asplenii]NMO00837.1 hypothetical protein [Gordonia asplenii]
MSVRRRNRQLIIDKQTGIVKGRRGAHPHKHLFDAVPLLAGDYPEATVPPMSMPEEAKQCLAVHVFDNLNLSTVAECRDRIDAALTAAGVAEEQRAELVAAHGPQDPAYKLVKNTSHGAQPMDLTGAMWVPKDTPEDAFTPAPEPELPISAEDVHAMSDEEADALQRRLDERAVQQARVKDLDQQPIDESEYRRVLGAKMNLLEDRLRRDGQQ